MEIKGKIMAAYKDEKFENDRSYVLGKTMADIVADGLRMDIIQKKIPTGSIITVKEVAERYGVSPMPVRDAFNTLKGEKLLEVSPYKHCKVLSIDRNYVSNIYGLADAIEGLLLEDAINNASDELISSVEKINERIKNLVANMDEDAVSEYQHLNAKFHQRLYSVSTNTIAQDLNRYYNDTIIDSFRIEYPATLERLSACYEEHQAIIDAVKNRDIPAARAALRSHNDNAKADFLKNNLD